MTRWQFLKKHWVMSLIVLVVSLVAIGAVIWAVVTGEGDEGFLEGKNGKPLMWEKHQFPLLCFYHTKADAHQQHIDYARDHINEMVGEELIRICDPWLVKSPFPKEPMQGVILLTLGTEAEAGGDGTYTSSPFSPQHGGTTVLATFKGTNNLYGAIIYVDPSAKQELLNVIWLHEFLHALGLKHDRLTSSIMYPVASGRPQKLSGRDIERLKEYK